MTAGNDLAPGGKTGLEERFARIPDRTELRDYNYSHFLPQHLLVDTLNTLRSRGLAPGELAPDFELPRVGGGTIRLSDLRGKPVLLHFGSFT